MAPSFLRHCTLPLLFGCLVAFLIITRTVPNPALSIARQESHAQPARRTTAKELLTRPLAQNLTMIPKLIHQSWKDAILPNKFEKWSRSCRKHNPGWEWILWTDEDNDALVNLYFSWFADTYKALPNPISRSDAVRNMYLYIFGG